MTIASLSCTTIEYSRLYSRWMNNPGDLLDFAGYDPMTDRLLDLCGGTGATAVDALHRGAKCVALVDLHPRCPSDGIVAIARDVNTRNSLSDIGQYDLVVIRQALGYLDLDTLVENLCHVVSDRGRVVFNTFTKPRWKLNTYLHRKCRFLEISVPVLGRIVHLQSRLHPDPDWDVSAFKWHKQRDIFSAFAEKFSLVKHFSSDTTNRYVYVRKDQT